MIKRNIILVFCAAVLIVSIIGCSTIASQPKSTPSVNASLNNHSNTTINAAPDWIHMFDEKNGYGESFDNPVMVTSNSGATWIDVTPRTSGDTPGTKVSGYFVNAKTGWTFQLQPEKSVTILGTQNGGQSWSQLATVPVKYGDGALFVIFSDARHGWFEETTAGINSPFSGELFSTGDGGNTWQRVASTEQGNLPFAGSLSVQKDGTIWLIGAGIRKSTNGGKTWSQVNLPLSADQKPEEVSKPVFFENNDGVIIIQLQEGGSVLYTTHDGGRTWSFQSKSPFALLDSDMVYDFIGNQEGWAINNGTGPNPSDKVFYVTQDGGYSWQTVPLNINLSDKFVKGINFVNSKVGWITYNESSGSGLAKSINGGISWEEIKIKGDM